MGACRLLFGRRLQLKCLVGQEMEYLGNGLFKDDTIWPNTIYTNTNTNTLTEFTHVSLLLPIYNAKSISVCLNNKWKHTQSAQSRTPISIAFRNQWFITSVHKKRNVNFFLFLPPSFYFFLTLFFYFFSNFYYFSLFFFLLLYFIIFFNFGEK